MAIDDILSKLHGYIFSEQEAEKIIAMVHGRTAITSKLKFQKGQTVRIIGPPICGYPVIVDGVIERKSDSGNYILKNCNSRWPASSLELVEEALKNGDEVLITGQGWECDRPELIGKTFRITEGPDTCRYKWACRSKEDHYITPGFPMYPASSLRKITKPQETDRLTAIEKQLVDQHKMLLNTRFDLIVPMKAAQDKLRKRCQEAEQRIMSLEEFSRTIDACVSANFLDIRELQEKELERTSRFPKGFKPESPVISKILDEPGLQKGDCVEVMRSSLVGTQNDIGKILRVDRIGKGDAYLVGGSVSWHNLDCLRKLSDAEIARKLNEARPC